jgi:type I restriction enzyme, S subunit
MNRFAKIKDIAVLNKETFKKDSLPKIIKYLDTGSLTKNKIEGFQLLNTKLDKIPSRAQRKVFTNTILYSTVRPNQEHYGIIERNSKDIVLSTGFTTIDITDEKSCPKFIYYLLTQKKITDYLHTIGMNAVSSYPSISPEDIGNLKFRLPDLPIQKSIAKVLSDLDAKIELNNRINRELEAMAKTLYDYWFVQFDFPFDFAQGKPNEQGKPYKSTGGKMVYNAELKREIPEGWEVGTLLDIATYTNGLACQKYRPINKNFLPVIKIREMREGFTENTEKVRDDIPDKLIVYNGDILFSWSASLEVMLWAGGKGGLNQHIFKVTSEKYPKSFYYFQLLWYLKQFKLIAELRKTTMGHITQDHLIQSRIVIPPLPLIERLDRIISPVLSKQIKLREENQELASLRDWLLPMLMNGQITVKEAEEKLDMAAEPNVEYAKK